MTWTTATGLALTVVGLAVLALSAAGTDRTLAAGLTLTGTGCALAALT